MYIKYSTRKFKASHLERIKSLKNQYASQDRHKSQEEIIVLALEVGINYLEQLLPDFVTRAVTLASKKRTAPMGIKDE